MTDIKTQVNVLCIKRYDIITKQIAKIELMKFNIRVNNGVSYLLINIKNCNHRTAALYVTV